jgi:hypothetical protein
MARVTFWFDQLALWGVAPRGSPVFFTTATESINVRLSIGEKDSRPVLEKHLRLCDSFCHGGNLD